MPPKSRWDNPDDFLARYLNAQNSTPEDAGALDPMPSPAQASMIDASSGPANIWDQVNQNKARIMGAKYVTPPMSGRTQGEELDTSGKQQGSRSQVTFASPEQIQEELGTWSRMPMFQQQQDEIDRQRQIASAMASQPQQANLSPLLALADKWYPGGGSLQAGYQAPPTPQEKASTLASYGNKIAQDQRDLSKNLVEAFKGSKAGQIQDLYQLLMTDKLKNMSKDPMAGGLGGVARIDANRVGAGSAYDKDPILRNITQTVNSLDRADSIMTGKTPVTGKNFAMLQQDLINAVAPGGAASEGKVNREMVDTLQATINNIEQKFGNVQDLRKEQPQIFSQLQSLVRQVKSDYNRAGKQRTHEININSQGAIDPGLRSVSDQKAGVLTKKFDTPVGPIGDTGDSVSVISPDGRTGKIPRSKLKDALNHGYKQAP